ncbi:hypothetical protein Pyn_06688 [Prunus yedoensis var. nudiflora]|uniref:Prolamin-like domain-containing protein n=1 Tax=Prunus yedoensis var. nudiflora TaxID=2094558 RepID=A0A315ASW4_PRUYE|nr:hypothetical protein Pyn_06688 [Prunus yedoensis var. nudiflora]
MASLDNTILVLVIGTIMIIRSSSPPAAAEVAAPASTSTTVSLSECRKRIHNNCGNIMHNNVLYGDDFDQEMICCIELSQMGDACQNLVDAALAQAPPQVNKSWHGVLVEPSGRFVIIGLKLFQHGRVIIGLSKTTPKRALNTIN